MTLSFRLVGVLILTGLLSGCGQSSQEASTPTQESSTPVRHIILFNEDGKKTVGLMKDTDALKVSFEMLKSPSAQTIAQFKAAEVEGKIFQVDSGTRAVILKEVPIDGVPGMSMMRIRISNGPREAEEALCFSTETQPDSSR
jgi:hypothetical protein